MCSRRNVADSVARFQSVWLLLWCAALSTWMFECGPACRFRRPGCLHEVTGVFARRSYNLHVRPIVTPHRVVPRVKDRSGCLNKVTGTFARHGANAQSLGFVRAGC